MLSIKEINLLQAQNEGLKKQNAELQKENARLKEENYNKLIAWEEMQAENERLKEEIKEVKKYQYQQEYLDKEIEIRDNLSEKFRKEALSWANIANGYQKDKTKLEQTLREIKKIAEAPKPFIDFSETKTAAEVEYDYAAICNELELRLHKVLELITKAESEVE